jgi:hypothetical protein
MAKSVYCRRLGGKSQDNVLFGHAQFHEFVGQTDFDAVLLNPDFVVEHIGMKNNPVGSL